jgi:hypothetical protein
MATTTTPQKEEKKIISPIDKQKNVENHKKIATHLETAAKHHEDAAKHHEADNHEKAAVSTVNDYSGDTDPPFRRKLTHPQYTTIKRTEEAVTKLNRFLICFFPE